MAKKASRKIPKAVRDFLAAAGRKGGKATGPSKARDPEKMREAQKARWAKHKDKSQGEEDKPAETGE